MKRRKIRHTFDIYDDQLQAMHTVQLEAVQAGKRKPTLGDMVQNALDDYFAKRNSKEAERTNGRTNETANQRSGEHI